MSEEELIRKAVELADGFEFVGEQKTLSGEVDAFVRTPFGSLHVSWEKFLDYPAFTDALAAQLVRQFMAKSPHNAIHHAGYTSVFEGGFQKCNIGNPCTVITALAHEFASFHKVLSEIEGEDFSMNAIKAIIESGVLKGESE